MTSSCFLLLPSLIKKSFLALKEIAKDKSPSIDSFTTKFSICSWDIIDNLFLAAIHHFFTHKKLPQDFKHTLLTFIPKSKHAITIIDFRLISLCSTFFKVIAKILASILKLTLPHLINYAQSTFIKGRDIFDNIALAQEICDVLNSSLH